MTKINFINSDGDQVAVWDGNESINVMQAAQDAGVDMEGACEGNMACATCHVILSKEDYDQLPDASEDEEDMLDFVPHLHSRSRLACQIMISENTDDMTVHLPVGVNNLM